jgi:hypothetical protein
VKDQIFPLCWYVWREKRHLLRDVFDISKGDEEFARWLTQMPERVMNAWIVFTDVWLNKLWL